VWRPSNGGPNSPLLLALGSAPSLDELGGVARGAMSPICSVSPEGAEPEPEPDIEVHIRASLGVNWLDSAGAAMEGPLMVEVSPADPSSAPFALLINQKIVASRSPNGTFFSLSVEISKYVSSRTPIYFLLVVVLHGSGSAAEIPKLELSEVRITLTAERRVWRVCPHKREQRFSTY